MGTSLLARGVPCARLLAASAPVTAAVDRGRLNSNNPVVQSSQARTCAVISYGFTMSSTDSQAYVAFGFRDA
jgi:hypothetical protein